jgi:glycolate oxidase FAD binding subunit
VDDAPCRIDDLALTAVVRPGSVAELGDLVRRAAAESQAVYPLGGRTMLAVGRPPDRPGYGADLRSFAAVVDYPARDMTITVQAGVTIAGLQRTLAAERQRLPVDVPRPEQATLGGALAVNVSGPRRYGYGTLRDYVIGISTVNDEGHETKAGGRVVKNVAGYDLCKLHIGALGTLGVITQVTLKVRPLAETDALVVFGCEAAALGPLLDRLHQGRTRPACVDVLNAAAARAAGLEPPDGPWVVVVGYEDPAEAMAWQVKQLLGEVGRAAVRELEVRAGSLAGPWWRALTESTWPEDARLTFKANLLPGAVAAFCLRAASAFPDFLRLHAHAGSGIVRGCVADALTLDDALAMLKELHAALGDGPGNLVLPRCPTEWKRAVPVWGRPGGDADLMRSVKAALDPRQLFNPGRFLDGI